MQASGLYLQSKCLPSLRAVLTLLEVVLRRARITDLVIVLNIALLDRGLMPEGAE